MKKYQIHLHYTQDAGDKKSNELHPSIYIKPLIFMLIIACKLHSNTQTSELKNAACPGILLDNKVPTTNEICFDIFLLFTAQLYPRLNTYYQESLVLQTSEGQSCYLCC